MKKTLLGILLVTIVVAIIFYVLRFYNSADADGNGNQQQLTTNKVSSAEADSIELLSGETYLGSIIRRTDDAVIFKPVVIGNINPTYTVKYSDIKNITLGKKKAEQAQNQPLLKSYYEIKDFKNKIYALYTNEDFAALESQITNFRDNKLRFASGDWKLDHFYNAITEKHGKQVIHELENDIARIEKWKQAYPNSVTPAILLIKSYIDLAWKYRGSTFSQGVTKAGRANFDKYLSKAAKLIATINDKTHASRDPQLYVASMTVCVGLGQLNECLLTLLNKATSYDPDYYAIHTKTAPYLLRRWNAPSGAVEGYADTVVKATENTGMYARIADSVYSYIGKNDFKQYEFDWNHIHDGFENIVKKYPANFYQLHAYARMACYYNDYTTVKNITDITSYLWNPQAKHVWGSFASYYACKTLANSERTVRINLHNEIRKGNYDKFKEIIKTGIDLNKPDSAGDTPLHHAIKSGFYKFAVSLINAGADIRARDKAGREPIHMVSEDGVEPLVSFLLEQGVPVNTRTKDTLWTPLHYVARNAARDKYINILKLLLRQDGIDINATTETNSTALHFAVYLGSEQAVSLLLEKQGIDPNISSQRRNKPLDLARQYKYASIEKLLLAHGATSDPNTITEEKRQLATQYFNQGLQAHNKNNYKKAKELYLKSLQLNPYAHGSYNNLALINIFENDYQTCFENTQKVLEIDKNNAHATLSAGQCLFMQRKPKKEFLPYYKRYTELKPDNHRSKELLQQYPELKTMPGSKI